MANQRGVAIAVVGGLIVLIIGAIVWLWLKRVGVPAPPPRETLIVLSHREKGAPCSVTHKEDVRGRRGGGVTWRVQNDCDTSQTFSLGNFRAAKDEPGNQGQPLPSGRDDCRDALVPGWDPSLDYPFAQPEDLQHRQVRDVRSQQMRPLPLTIKPLLHGREAIYYHFDVCLGDQAGTVDHDPGLMIEEEP
jgi:hypothetical protein